MAVAADDVAALMLDEDWLRQKLRLALEIESRDGIDDLGVGVWRLAVGRGAAGTGVARPRSDPDLARAGTTRSCACAKAKMLAPISREERAQ